MKLLISCISAPQISQTKCCSSLCSISSTGSALIQSSCVRFFLALVLRNTHFFLCFLYSQSLHSGKQKQLREFLFQNSIFTLECSIIRNQFFQYPALKKLLSSFVLSYLYYTIKQAKKQGKSPDSPCFYPVFFHGSPLAVRFSGFPAIILFAAA